MFLCITSRRKDQNQDFRIQLRKLEHQESIDPVSTRALQIATLKDHLSDLKTHRKKSAAIYHFDRDVNKSDQARTSLDHLHRFSDLYAFHLFNRPMDLSQRIRRK